MFQKFCFQIKTIFGYQVVNKISGNMSNKKMPFFMEGFSIESPFIAQYLGTRGKKCFMTALLICEGSVKKLFHHAFSVSGII